MSKRQVTRMPWEWSDDGKYAMNSTISTPLIYFGGKSLMADDIISLLPPHETYVEMFGGGAAVLLKKNKSRTEVYNDIGNVYNFFKVLRDNGEELVNKLLLTLYSRQEFKYAVDYLTKDNFDKDPVEWARLWYVLIIQGFTHTESCDGWRVSKTNDSAASWMNGIDRLKVVVARMQQVILENYSFEKIIELYDSPHTLFYCDPPYVLETRSGDRAGYKNEMSLRDHDWFLQLITRIKGQAVISGYGHKLYDRYLNDWKIVSRTRRSYIHNTHQEPGERTEVIWIKEHSSGLWS